MIMPIMSAWAVTGSAQKCTPVPKVLVLPKVTSIQASSMSAPVLRRYSAVLTALPSAGAVPLAVHAMDDAQLVQVGARMLAIAVSKALLWSARMIWPAATAVMAVPICS